MKGKRMTFRMTRENELNFIAKACRDNEEVYASIMPGAFMRQAEKFLKEGGSVLPEGVEVEYLCSTSGAFPRSYEYKLNEWKRLLDFIG